MSEPCGHDGHPRRGRRRRLLGIALLLIVPLALLGIREVLTYQAQRRLQELTARADADDPGWRLERLRSAYEAQPVNEHLIRALEAFPRNPTYQGWHGDDLVSRPGAVPYNPSQHPNARLPEQYLAILRERVMDPRVEPMRQALRALGDAPAGRLPNVYRNAGNFIQSVRCLANYQADELLLALHDRRLDDVVRTARDRLHLVRPVNTAPELLTQLVRIALIAAAVNDVQTILVQDTLTDEQLRQLQRMLSDQDRVDPVPLARLLRAELHDQMLLYRRDEQAWERLWDSFYQGAPSGAPRWRRAWVEVERFIAFRLDIQALTATHAELLDALNRIVEEAQSSPDVRLPPAAWAEQGRLFRILSGGPAKVLGAQVACVAQGRCAAAAIACERYRLATGRWPTALTDLVPQYLPRVPLDPFSQQPLLYRILPDGAVVYSVSRDLVDDAGAVLYTPNRGQPDRGVRLYHPEKRGLRYEEVYSSSAE